MNYIKQLNEFYSTLDYKPLTAEAISIYFMLLQIANKTGWIDKFRVANTILMSKCNIDKQKMIRARNNLISQGYILYWKGKNQAEAPMYSIVKLYRNTPNDTPNNTPNDTPSNTPSNTPNNTPNDTINKQNKTETKQNKTETTVAEKNKKRATAAVDDEKLQEMFIKCIGSTNLNAISECISYLEDLPREVIEIALKKTSEVNGKWKYTKVILNNWVENRIDTVEKVQAEDLKFKNKKQNEETEEERQARILKEMEESLKDVTT